MPTSTNSSIFETITNRIVDAIEVGTLPWRRPWRQSPHQNAATGHEYRGINALALTLTALEQDYHANGWLTYLQAKRLGGHVRKGERATTVVWWKLVDRRPMGEDSEPAETPERFWLARTYYVFNVAQVEGLEEIKERLLRPASFEPIAECEQIVAKYGADIRHGGGAAFYSPDGDFVQLPSPTVFEHRERYYGVLAHELIHHTGAPHRLNRDLSGRFGSDAYAFEELVAELGSAFLTARMGIPHETQPSAAYIQSWLRVLRGDTRAVFTAARLAQQATDYIAPCTQADDERSALAVTAD